MYTLKEARRSQIAVDSLFNCAVLVRSPGRQEKGSPTPIVMDFGLVHPPRTQLPM